MVAAADPAAPPPYTMRRKVGGLLTLFGYLFPFILMVMGYLLAPPLRHRVLESIPANEILIFAIGLVAVILAAAGWIIIDLLTLTRTLLSGEKLRENAVVSVVVGILFSNIAVFMGDRNALAWVILIPAIAAVLDAVISVWVAINQALLKRVLQEEAAIH
jgi:hypothetical protein